MAREMRADTLRAVKLVREVLSTGAVHDPIDGRTTAMIADAAGLNVALCSQVLQALQARGEIEREIVGKRCYAVRLLDAGERGAALRSQAAAAAERQQHPSATARPVAVATAAESPPEPSVSPAGASDAAPALRIVQGIVDAHSERQSAADVNHAELAAELLRQVIDAAAGPNRVMAELRSSQQQLQHELSESRGRFEREQADVLGRLGSAVEESQRLRKRLAIAEERCVSAQLEIDGLRSRAQQAERNLDRVLKGGMLDKDRESELREIMVMMRAMPASSKGRDDEPTRHLVNGARR